MAQKQLKIFWKLLSNHYQTKSIIKSIVRSWWWRHQRFNEWLYKRAGKISVDVFGLFEKIKKYKLYFERLSNNDNRFFWNNDFQHCRRLINNGCFSCLTGFILTGYFWILKADIEIAAYKGLAKYGRTESIFVVCNSIVLWFGAGHYLFSFLLLSSTKVFQSAFVPGLTSIYSRTSPSINVIGNVTATVLLEIKVIKSLFKVLC